MTALYRDSDLALYRAQSWFPPWRWLRTWWHGRRAEKRLAAEEARQRLAEETARARGDLKARGITFSCQNWGSGSMRYVFATKDYPNFDVVVKHYRRTAKRLRAELGALPPRAWFAVRSEDSTAYIRTLLRREALLLLEQLEAIARAL